MPTQRETPTVTESIRGRTSGFVNDHADVWVAAEEDGVLALGGDDAALLFAAAADWLRGDTTLRVADLRWSTAEDSPRHLLRLWLERAAPR